MAGIHCGLAGSGDGYITVFLTIAGDTNNYVLNTAKVPTYVAGATRVVLTVNAGVTVGGGSSGAAFTVDTSWASLDKVEVVNNGKIIGFGGAGGTGSTAPAGTNGSPGGTALVASRPVRFTNNGQLLGGGGGGGASAFDGYIDPYYSGYFECVSGGGGAGVNPGSAASAGAGNISQPASNGSPTNGGAGAVGGSLGYTGGAGGNPGQAGQSGTGSPQYNNYRPPGTGGAAGFYVQGNTNVTWVANGTRLGNVA